MSSLQSLERALDMLILINENGGSLSVNEIANIMNIHRSTVHRTLTTMYNKEFLSKDPQTGQYTIGSKSLMFNFSGVNNFPIVSITRPYMAFLGEKYNQYISLSVIVNSNVYVITHYSGYFNTTFYSIYDDYLVSNAYRPAISHCLMAYNCELDTSNPVIQTYFDKIYNSPSHKTSLYSSLDGFVSYLKKIKNNGYSYESSELENDEVCYCVPIHDERKAIATLSLHGQKSLLNKHKKSDMLESLLTISKTISKSYSK